MEQIYFVYRTHYEGPLSKRVVRLPGESVLAWFQGVWHDAKRAEKAWDWSGDVCGGDVYGFSTIFEAVKRYDLPPPQTWQELNALLKQYLYVEGEIRQDAHTLRVKTDDDELDLAYFFFSQEYANAHQARVAYLLQEEWNLPIDYCDGQYEPPIETSPLLPAGVGCGYTYVCLLTWADSDTFESVTAAEIKGVRLPDLCSYLRQTIPIAKARHLYEDDTWINTWPLELRLLWAMIEIDDKSIEPALQRCNQYPVYELSQRRHTRLGIGSYENARNEFETVAKSLKREGSPSKSLMACCEHLAQLCIHITDWAGYQQWFIFDDQWAVANSALADSLLRYASQWDPFS